MAQSLEQLIDEVREALQTQLHARGPSLAVQLRKAGRQLPRAVRRDGAYLVESARLAANPKLARQIDMRRVQTAQRRILLYLETIDLAAKRRDLALQIVASVAFAVLVTGALLIAVLAWRGFV